MSQIVFELVSPEGILVSEEVKELVLRTESGEIGILKNHADLKSKVVAGTLKYKNLDNQAQSLEISGGVIEVSKNKITVLTNSAQRN